MYGYIEPLKDELICSEFALYKSHYCGMCKNLGKQFGQLPRLTTSYDITFLSVLLSSYMGDNLSYNKERCILSLKKKPRVLDTPLLKDIANASLILSYYKALDGVIDKDGTKYGLLKSILNRASKKAIKALPDVENIVKLNYNNLRKLEKEKCDSVDRLADCFAIMLRDVVAVLIERQSGRVASVDTENCDFKEKPNPCNADCGRQSAAPTNAEHLETAKLNDTSNCRGGTLPPENNSDNVSTNTAKLTQPLSTNKKDNDELLSLCYNIGKFVYIIDALDDIEKDFKKNRPNPFLFSNILADATNTKKNKNIKQNFIKANHDTLTFIFATTVNRTIESFNNILHRFNGDDVVGLLQNIIYKGLRAKVDKIINA